MSDAGPYTVPRRRDEVPLTRQLGFGVAQDGTRLDYICGCPEPCNSANCPNLVWRAPHEWKASS